MEKLSVSECVRYGWETFKQRPWFLVGAIIVYGLLAWAIGFISGVIASAVEPTSGEAAAGFASFVISFPLNVLLAMGLIVLSLKAHDNISRVSLHDFWAPNPFWKFIGAKVLSGFLVIVGFILLIVPGIILSLMFFAVPYLVMERKLRPIEVLKESHRLTKGHKWNLLVLLLVLALINIVGLLALVVGLLVTIPVTILAQVHAYRWLERKANELVPAPAPSLAAGSMPRA